MANRHFLYLGLLSLCAAGGGHAQARQGRENPPVERTDPAPFMNRSRRYASVEEERSARTVRSEASASMTASTFFDFSAVKTGNPTTYRPSLKIVNSSVVAGIQLLKQRANPNCREWRDGACTVCGIDSAISISLKNKTKTPLLLCQDMKPGPARVVMMTHAEPTIPGLWEVEFGLGYQTSARNECPHQFVASNNPPLKTAYEVGPITIEGEIPPDGMIQTLACVGLSSARLGEEGKETGASLKVFELRVVSE